MGTKDVAGNEWKQDSKGKLEGLEHLKRMLNDRLVELIIAQKKLDDKKNSSGPGKRWSKALLEYF